ncbi:amidase family protein [Cordyceps javanica]|uniref:Amidase family protein n=1 Tax=Cordyceps javanica TaxID=43265 RepID=A0A545V0C7_9HYPO|nr:amidase family protein [Cordyceps javanica]TQW05646.1 amidase family protein [Cordyceps javanica]
MAKELSVFNVVEASLEDIQAALTDGTVTCVQLVTEYLRRISAYDCRGPSLNSVPIINPLVFEEAAASDDRRSSGATLGPLDGIPYTAKDSYKVRGMTVANGATAFEHLVSNTDAFTIQALRAAGAVLIGKTNMPPMAAGGMQRGVYGRAESPYNAKFLAAAFASGSSNGSAVSTAASLAAFGLGEETVSSGRSPASNNAIVAFTPSRGNISIRGNWPLYSLCDVVVPHTRSMSDLFGLLDVIAQPDNITKGDFWRHQTLVELPQPWQDRPNSFYHLREGPALQKIRVAVPDLYTVNTNKGGDDIDGVYVSDAVRDLWKQARADLEGLGAEVIPVADFPVVTEYEAHAHIGSEDQLGMPKNWKQVERAQLPALAWTEFLQDNNDANVRSLEGIDPLRIWPFRDQGDPQVRFFKTENAVLWDRLQEYVAELRGQTPPVTTQYQVPGLGQAVRAVETLRQSLLEDWMTARRFDFVAFPAAGDVGRADADVCAESARHAWTNGVKYSNGNQALRHLGVPSVTVPMGVLAGKAMPVGLTILGRAYDDVRILRLGYLYEQASRRRRPPSLTPELPKAACRRHGCFVPDESRQRPLLEGMRCASTTGTDEAGGVVRVSVSGRIKATESNGSGWRPVVQVYVDGDIVAAEHIDMSEEEEEEEEEGGLGTSSFRCNVSVPPRPRREAREAVHGKIARDMIMVVVVASVGHGRPSGWLGFIE